MIVSVTYRGIFITYTAVLMTNKVPQRSEKREQTFITTLKNNVAHLNAINTLINWFRFWNLCCFTNRSL